MNLVALKPEFLADLELKKKKVEGRKKCIRKCRHIVIDPKSRTIECQDCGFTLDPFDYLLHWAEEGEERMEGLKRIITQRRIAQAEHDDLERKIKNMRQQLKRAGSPQTPEERRHFDMMRWNPHLVKGLEKPDT